jgi:hypothetical protein
MRLSARNQLKGTVTKPTKGATTSHVVVDIGMERRSRPLSQMKVLTNSALRTAER